VAKTLDSDESDGAFVLTPDIIAPTLEEVAAVQAEVDDDALTKATESVKSIVRLSGRRRVDTQKMLENKAAQLEATAESEWLGIASILRFPCK
jgi:hypothetical protein